MNAVFEQIFQVGFLAAIIRIATPLAFATLGEMISERSGVLNLGIEGIMLLSAMTGFTAAYFSSNLWVGVLVAAATGALMAAVHAVFTVGLGLSQHVCDHVLRRAVLQAKRSIDHMFSDESITNQQVQVTMADLLSS